MSMAGGLAVTRIAAAAVRAEPVIQSAAARLLVLGIAVLATGTAAGIAMLGPVVSVRGSAQRALWVTALAGSAALLMAIDVAGLPSAAPVATAAATLALPYLSGRRGAMIVVGALDVAAVGGCAGFVAARSVAARPVWYVATAAAIALAAAVGLGVGVGLLTVPVDDRAARARRFAPYLLSAGAALAAAVAARSLVPGAPSTVDLARAVAAGGCLVGATVMGVRHWRGRVPGGTPVRTWAVAVAVVLVLVPVGTPRSTLVTGTPLVTLATVTGVPVSVLVAPGRPGLNLVHLGVDGASVGTDRAHLVRATKRPATQYGWAEVYLPPGRSQLWVGYGEQAVPVTVDTGTGKEGPDLRGPNGPECASAALGLVLSHSTAPLTTCPSDGLGLADAAALRGIIRFIADRGVRAISLVADSSPRGVAARALVEAEAGRYGMTVGKPTAGRPMLVVSGWGPALAAVEDVSAGRRKAQGTYLAPWLLNTAILNLPAGQLIPLRFDPEGAPALAYVAALHAWFRDEPATTAGFLAWSRASGDPVRLYAASTVSGASMGGMPGMMEPSGAMPDMPAAGDTWLPDGGIVPVTGPLDVR